MKGLIFVFLISRVLGATLSIASISPDSLLVQAVTNYQVTILTETTIPINSIILIQFPSDFTNLTQGTITCQFEASSLNTAGASCTMSGNNLTISGLFTSSFSPGFIDFTINSITNPLTSKTISSFKIYIRTSGGAVIDSKETDLTLKYNSRDISSASISTDSKVCGVDTTWTFTFTTILSIPSSGTIVVKFPFWNQHLTGSTSPYRSFINSTITCTGTLSNL
jgi:hypothetical protein